MNAGRALLLAVPIAGLAELGMHLYFAARPPSFDEWAQIEEPVRTFADRTAPIVVAPLWAEPLARKALGDDRMPIEHVARADMSRFQIAVEVSILGERAPELAGWTEEARETHGKLTLRRLRNPAFRAIVTDFVERARPPFAEVTTTDPPGACKWNEHARTLSGGLGGNPTFPARRFECAMGPFFHVGETVIADEEFRPRRCLWSHPPERGEIVTRFRDAALGERIEGHAGMYWMIERELAGAPVFLTVRVDGEELAKIEHVDGMGWSAFEVPLGAHAGERHADVEFGVSSPKHLHRHFCFEATSR